MRQRPVRSNLYLPVVILKVVSSDWKFVLAATLIGYLVPFFFGLKIWIIPAWLFTGLGALILSVVFFSFIRAGRRPRWFEHTLFAALRSKCERRRLPLDEMRSPARPWVQFDRGK